MPLKTSITSIAILVMAIDLRRVSGFVPVVSPRRSICNTGSKNLHASSPGNVQRPENEFSREYKTETILRQKNDYILSITAEEEERVQLAKRFALSNIAKLEADLSLRREGAGINRHRRSANTVPAVEVDGTIVATVTQKCVRTGENFDVDLEFPIVAIVRPLQSAWKDGDEDEDDDDQPKGFKNADIDREKDSKRKKKRNQRQIMNGSRNIKELDMEELQRMLQDVDVDDDVIEDEAIYSLSTGMLDVGELVSQLLILKLDPYPKKPGTKPISMTFRSTDFGL